MQSSTEPRRTRNDIALTNGDRKSCGNSLDSIVEGIPSGSLRASFVAALLRESVGMTEVEMYLENTEKHRG